MVLHRACARVLLVLVSFGVLLPGRSAAEIGIQGGLVKSPNPAFDSLILLEFPFVVSRSSFEFVRSTSDSAYYADVFARITLINAAGRNIDSSSTQFTVRCESAGETVRADVRLFNRLALPAPPGLYSARLEVIDLTGMDSGALFYDEILVEPPAEQLAIGGVRLAYRIRAVDTSGSGYSVRMIKNGLEILTNPAGLFSVTDSMTYVYAELYSMDTQEPDSSYRIGYRILDRDLEEVQDFGFALRRKPGPTAVAVQKLTFSPLLSGMYTLEIAAADPASGEADTARVPFRVLSPQDILRLTEAFSAGDEEQSAYDQLPLEEQINVVRYRLTSDQRQTLANLNENGKKNFLSAYWQRNDQNPETAVNETRAVWLSLYKYAIERYSTSTSVRDGWRTDRGRILLTHGHPDNIDSKDAPVLGEGWEIWRYDQIKEGLVFVFLSSTGLSEYRLVHSNAGGEIYNQEWADRLSSEGFQELGEQ